jgi:hypothetical protein
MLSIRRLRGAVLAVILLTLATTAGQGQEVVDKTVAALTDGTRTELITYSDLMWQLALQPGTPLSPPRREDLNAALQTLINQRLFALEAERLPRLAPTPAEIAAKIAETLTYFPSTAVFEERLRTVGFSSVKDENFERIIAQRVAIDNYINFRFESFVVVTPDEEARYFREQFLPDFRRRNPGRAVPTLDETRREITKLITNERVATRIETFLDEARRRVTIDILIEV